MNWYKNKKTTKKIKENNEAIDILKREITIIEKQKKENDEKIKENNEAISIIDEYLKK